MIEETLERLGIKLPPVPAPPGNYVNAVEARGLLFLAGKGARNTDGSIAAGKVGKDVTTEQAYQHARSVGLTLIAVMKESLGNLDRVKRIVKVLGMVNAAPDFQDHPKVINGCSDLFAQVFGERGRHARSAVGMGSLPNSTIVEIEVIVEIE